MLSLTAAHADLGVLSASLDKSQAKPGDIINWKIDVSCADDYIVQVWVTFDEPTGQPEQVSTPGGTVDQFKKNGTSGTITLSLKITNDAVPGKYAAQSVQVTCYRTNNRYKYITNLEALSFTVLDVGQMAVAQQPRLEKIEMTTPGDRAVGDKIQFHVIASGTGKLYRIDIFLRNANGLEAFQRYIDSNPQNAGETSKRLDTTLTFDVNSDLKAGTYYVSEVFLESYAGTDLTTLNPADIYERDTTAFFDRSVTISNTPGLATTGWPENGAVKQADITGIKISVTNPDSAPIIAPEITSLSIPVTQIRAGDTFDLIMNFNGKGAFLYSAFAAWIKKDNKQIALPYCSLSGDQLTSAPKSEGSQTLHCQTLRSSAVGSYWLNQLSIYTTSCDLSPFDIGSQANQSCQQVPKQRRTDYFNYEGTLSVTGYPVFSVNPPNVLNPLTILTVSSPGPLTRPDLLASDVGEIQITLTYPPSDELACSYVPSMGNAYPNPSKKGEVLISNLNPNTVINVSATCTSTDHQTVSFVDSFKTKLPDPPYLPKITTQRISYNEIEFSYADSKISGNTYQLTSSQGSVHLVGDKVLIQDLLPNESFDVAMKVTDAYGQITEGHLATFTTAPPPKLSGPHVWLLKTVKGIYYFTFKPSPDQSYAVACVACTAKIKGSSIQILGLQSKKTATASLIVNDNFNQTLTLKFFQLHLK
jgi:hypothetical protein